MENEELKKIKKDYGENMAHLCRELFPTILEKPGVLYKILTDNFAKSKDLYFDIVNEKKKILFKNYIYTFFDMEISEVENEPKPVEELLASKGYKIYECKDFWDTQRFREYYSKLGQTLGSKGYSIVGNIREITIPEWMKKKPYNKYIKVDSNGDIFIPNHVGEELCTFSDLSRINNYYIFFIVREDANTIKRKLNPKREDDYSTSVLDLQFDKGEKQSVSIKSRYNHTVERPDAVSENNLDEIVPGLTRAFERDYGFNIGGEYKAGFGLLDYVRAKGGKFYKYNHEINNIHYCPNNIIIDNGNIIDTYSDKSRYTFMDYFILDEVEKKIILYDSYIQDSFLDDLQNITKIEINNKEGYKEVKLTLEEEKEAIIKLDKRGRIIGYINNNLKECNNYFLSFNKNLQELNLPNLISCGSWFLNNNKDLKSLSLPKLEKCGDMFLAYNESLQELNLPSLEKCGTSFLTYNELLEKLILPNLVTCDSGFLRYNEQLQTLNLPKLEKCGDKFLYSNNSLQTLNLPNLETCGYSFLGNNECLQILNLPNLKECGEDFLSYYCHPKALYIPKLKSIDYKSLPPRIKFAIFAGNILYDFKNKLNKTDKKSR